jgi:tRNA threonylcarbamoyl adenosine modification protein YeaZ
LGYTQIVIVVALDSTTPIGSVAVAESPQDVDVRAGDASRGWGERLPGDVLTVLDAHGLRLSQVDVFAVAAGPGSLTGLRVGIATIQGFAFATGRSVAAVSALDLLAEHAATRGRDAPAWDKDGPRPLIGAWTNALRGEVFTALYQLLPADEPGADPWLLVDGPQVGSPAAAAAAWRRRAGDRPLVVAGDVDADLGAVLAASFGPAVTMLSRPLLAGPLVRVAFRRAARGELVVPHAVRPVYVRKPDAVLARERGAAGAVIAPLQPGLRSSD